MNLFKSIFFIFFSVNLLTAGGEWELQKSSDIYSAYTKGSSKKQYMVKATLNIPMDSVYSFLTNYEDFPKYYENIKSIKVIDRSDSSVYHYSVIKTTWPLKDRDMVTKITISKELGSKIIMTSLSANDIVQENRDLVRINDFEEQLELSFIGLNKTSLLIKGSIGIKEKIPSWLENKLILSGPVRTIEILNSRYKTE